jgi:nitrate/TMAO reductase-like tetraheme cytochrome c subunit
MRVPVGGTAVRIAITVLLVILVSLLPKLSFAVSQSYCLACHGQKGFPGGYVGQVRYVESVHGTRPCTACHLDVFSFPHKKVAKVDCSVCHLAGTFGAPTQPAKQYWVSVHGQAVKKGVKNAPICQTCHGSHYILPPQNPQSRVNRKNIPQLCSHCHEYQYEQYMKSIHARAFFQMRMEKSAVCYDCHEEHRVPGVTQPRWKLWLVKECGYCHQRELATYRDTIHGEVNRLGYTTVARCPDCHGSHDILPPSNPNSTLFFGPNRVHTCRKCHPSATLSYTEYYAHPNMHDRAKYPLLYYTHLFMRILIFSVFGFFSVHTFLWAYRSLKERPKTREEK